MTIQGIWVLVGGCGGGRGGGAGGWGGGGGAGGGRAVLPIPIPHSMLTALNL